MTSILAVIILIAIPGLCLADSAEDHPKVSQLEQFKGKMKILHSLLKSECPKWAEQHEKELYRQDAVERNVEIVKILFHRLENTLIECRKSGNKMERKKQVDTVKKAVETTTLTFLLKITKGLVGTTASPKHRTASALTRPNRTSTAPPITKPHYTTYVLPTMQVITMGTSTSTPTASILRRRIAKR